MTDHSAGTEHGTGADRSADHAAERAAHRPPDRAEFTEGGDPVCWLDRVCEECGAFREDMASPVCARCGTPFATEDGGGPPAPARNPDTGA